MCERVYLHIKEVELDWIIPVHVLIRKEKLLSESEHNGLFNALLTE